MQTDGLEHNPAAAASLWGVAGAFSACVAVIAGAFGAHALRASLTRAAGAFLAGTVLFSGSLYALALTGQRWLGAVTPLGGTAFIAGWLLLAWGLWLRPTGRGSA